MTRDEMEHLPCIVLASPLGAGVMMGLKKTICQNHPIEPGTWLGIHQHPHPAGKLTKRYQQDFRKLQARAQDRGHESLIHMPDGLALVTSRGLLGAARVEACRRNGDCYVITLAEPTRLPKEAAA